MNRFRSTDAQAAAIALRDGGESCNASLAKSAHSRIVRICYALLEARPSKCRGRGVIEPRKRLPYATLSMSGTTSAA